MTQDELKKNVDTIAVLILENRSFDHVFGHLRSPLYGNRTDVRGIEDVNNPDYLNANNDGHLTLSSRPRWRIIAPVFGPSTR